MTSIYVADHADALADIQEAGAAADFVLSSAGTYDPATDTHTAPGTTTVSGYAIEDEGDPEEYDRLSLVSQIPATLIWCPVTFGAVPALDSVVSWGGHAWTLRARKPLVAPDGNQWLLHLVVIR